MNPEQGIKRFRKNVKGEAPRYLVFKNSIYAVDEIESIKRDCTTQCIHIYSRNGSQSIEPSDEKYWESLKKVFIEGMPS